MYPSYILHLTVDPKPYIALSSSCPFYSPLLRGLHSAAQDDYRGPLKGDIGVMLGYLALCWDYYIGIIWGLVVCIGNTGEENRNY